MPFDWDQFRRDSRQAAEEASQETDDNLASRISSVSTLTDDVIKELFPVPAEAAKLAELIANVKDATDHNTKIANLERDIANYSAVIIKLLAKLA